MENLKLIKSDSFGIYEIPEAINDFRKFWECKFEQVPKEYQDSITIDFMFYDSYGAPGLDVTIYYQREKTKAEIEDEKKKFDHIQMKKRKRQREEYDRLKKIFEDE